MNLVTDCLGFYVCRRSLMFQEVLAIIATSPNLHQWPHSALQTYWFGFYEDVEQRVPTILPVSIMLRSTTPLCTQTIQRAL